MRHCHVRSPEGNCQEKRSSTVARKKAKAYSSTEIQARHLPVGILSQYRRPAVSRTIPNLQNRCPELLAGFCSNSAQPAGGFYGLVGCNIRSLGPQRCLHRNQWTLSFRCRIGQARMTSLIRCLSRDLRSLINDTNTGWQSMRLTRRVRSLLLREGVCGRVILIL